MASEISASHGYARKSNPPTLFLERPVKETSYGSIE